MSNSRIKTSLFLFISLTFLGTSCIVSKKKYEDLLAQKIRTESELMDRTNKLNESEGANRDLDAKVKSLMQDTARLSTRVTSFQEKLSLLQKDYDQLNGNYRNLLNSSGKLNRDLGQQREQLLAIQDNLDKTRRTNDSLSSSLAEREKKVRELEQILSEKDKAVRNLKDQITNALLSFKESDLTVQVKNGKVYVSLSEQLLFQTASTQVDAKGVSALQQLAKALKDQKGIHIMVEGHTDNVPFSRALPNMEDNWDLSVLRATSITRILTKNGVNPSHITASGKGEFSPLVPNANKENQQKNRRTEIIITPNLDELFKILEAN
ncbi:MAG: OmpA family protein [Bacteroidetes bacterium]|nr:OmpA family protein [Bacteroidota bacterium]